MELKVTKEKVLEATEVNSEAKEVLKTLFPDVFDKIELSGDIYIDDIIVVQNRVEGEFKNKSLWLSPHFNWRIETDDLSQKCLVPTKKNTINGS